MRGVFASNAVLSVSLISSCKPISQSYSGSDLVFEGFKFFFVTVSVTFIGMFGFGLSGSSPPVFFLSDGLKNYDTYAFICCVIVCYLIINLN